MLVQMDGSITGTIGGGALEYAVIKQARAAIMRGKDERSKMKDEGEPPGKEERGNTEKDESSSFIFDLSSFPTMVQHRLTHDHNMCCGGTVHIYIEAIEVPPQCFIFGAGHVGKALAALISTLDFEVVLIDGRPNMLDGIMKNAELGMRNAGDSNPIPNSSFLIPNSQLRYINEEPSKAISSLGWDSNTFAIIATHSHPLDREILRLILAHEPLRQPFKYCGMIGSKRKVIVTRKLFLERGWATDEELDRIDMPIGVDIAASSPTEIAVSIAARMIEVKNRKPTCCIAQTPSLPHTLHQFNPDYTNDFACASTTV
jgi:xanthine dehydrogenase accessory factor